MFLGSDLHYLVKVSPQVELYSSDCQGVHGSTKAQTSEQVLIPEAQLEEEAGEVEVSSWLEPGVELGFWFVAEGQVWEWW